MNNVVLFLEGEIARITSQNKNGLTLLQRPPGENEHEGC